MKSKKIKPAKSDSSNPSSTIPDNAISDRKTILTAKRLETVVAILLGITTLLSAWATPICL